MIHLFSKHPQYNYIVQEREFLNQNLPICKIGKTSRTIEERLKGYPKGTKIIIQIEVSDSTEIETMLKNEFKKVFKHRNDIGSEYFEGDIGHMVDYFCKIISKYENDKRTIYNLKNFDEINSNNISMSNHPTSNPVPKFIIFNEIHNDYSSNKNISIENNGQIKNTDAKEEYDVDTKVQKEKNINPVDEEYNANFYENNKEKYICHRCDKIFNSKEGLMDHWKSITPCDFICVDCGMRLHTRTSYYKHRNERNKCSYLPKNNIIDKIFLQNRKN